MRTAKIFLVIGLCMTLAAGIGLASDTIYKGESLVIPGTQPGSGQMVTHVVQPGETLEVVLERREPAEETDS